VLVLRERQTVHLYTRDGHDWAERFPGIVDLALALKPSRFLLDSEVMVAACNLGFEGIVSKRKGSRCRSGRSPHWLKSKNPNSEAVRRETAGTETKP